jgi:hypothetical protein
MRLSRFLLILLLLCLAQSGAPHAAQASSPAPDINCNLFPADNIWNTPINTLPVDSASTNIFLNAVGGTRGMHADFGAGQWDGADIGIPIAVVNGSQPTVPINYTAYGDESDPGPFPIPPTAPIEGGPNGDGDRHVLVVDDTNCILYELYRAFPQGGGTSWNAESGARYDLTSHNLRPASWTSADAAGLPILPGLVRYQEILAGSINHAIRFTLQRTGDAYVWPARHEASSYSPSLYLPMGARLRLKQSFDISGFHPTVQIILQAMKTYGIIVADNGSNMFFQGTPDSRWNDSVLQQFSQVTAANFEVVDTCSLQVSANSGQAQVGANPPPNNCTSLASGGNQFVPMGVTNTGYGNPLYQWLDLPGAQYYYLYIVNSSGTQIINEVIADAGNCNGDTCSFDPTTLREQYRLVNGTYTAYMNTWNGSVQGTWRGPFTFTLNAAPPDLPLLSPPSNTNTLRPTFNWSLPGNAAHAMWLNVYIVPASSPSTPVINQWLSRTQACGSPTGTSCAFVAPLDLLDGVSYNLYLRSYGPGGLSNYTSAQNFSVDAPPPALPSGIVVNNQQGRATITWNNDTNALWLNVMVTNAAGTTTYYNNWHARADICSASCVLTPNLNLVNGSYTVSIRAWGAGGFNTGGTNGYATQPFTFNFAAPDISGATPITPTGSIPTGSPTFSWNTIAGATWYYLGVGGASFNPVYFQQWYDASTICTPHPGTCTLANLVNLPVGAAVWKVQAWGPGGISVLSSERSFTVNATLPLTLSLTSPTGTIDNNAPSYVWADDPSVDWYNVYVGTSTSTVSNMWYRAERGPGKLCNAGACTLVLTGVTLANGSYTWNARGYSPAGLGNWAAGQSFVVSVPIPAIPTLVTPTEGAVINSTNRPTFVWNTSAHAQWYNLEIKNGMGTVVFTQWYQAGVGGCTISSCTQQLPNPIGYGGYTWRVRAWSQGGLGEFSAPRSFFALSINAQPMMVQGGDGRVGRSGTWTETTSETAVEQSYLTSSGSGADTLTFAFSGSAAAVVYIAGPAYGSFVIEVDGVPMRAVNANAAQGSVGNLAGVSGLMAGEHVLRIVPLGGAPVAIDGVIVDGQVLVAGTPVPTPSPTMEIPTVVVTDEATPTGVPTDAPTAEPTAAPTAEPTAVPTDAPTVEVTTEASPIVEVTAEVTPMP